MRKAWKLNAPYVIYERDTDRDRDRKGGGGGRGGGENWGFYTSSTIYAR